MMEGSSAVQREANVLRINRMDDPLIVSACLHELYNLVEKRGYKDIVLDCEQVGRVFPNVIVPLAGILDYYRTEKGIDFQAARLTPFLQKSHFLQPLAPNAQKDVLKANALNIVWQYQTDQDTSDLSNEILRSVSEDILCEEGVINALLWCMNEVMDNVIVHAESAKGFVMCQIHKQSKHLSFCVYDHGRGIYNSLKDSAHRPQHPLQAIELAIQERVTRDRKVGQGNGLWGLSEIVKKNSGRLTIISGPAMLMRTNGNVKTSHNLTFLDNSHQSCLVDFQLNYNRPISLADTFKHTPVNYRTDKFEDYEGLVHYRLIEAVSGTGTRMSGKKIRTDLINLFQESKKGIVIDFEGLKVISSSFADELVGKMVTHFGFLGFNQIVKLKNANETIQAIIQRSVAQRMAEDFT